MSFHNSWITLYWNYLVIDLSFPHIDKFLWSGTIFFTFVPKPRTFLTQYIFSKWPMNEWERLMKDTLLQKMVTKKRVVWNVLWQIYTSVSFMLSGGSRYSNSNDKHPLLRQRGTQIEKEIYLKYYRKSTLNILWKDWCWSWSSNILTTWYEELTHWKRTTDFMSTYFSQALCCLLCWSFLHQTWDCWANCVLQEQLKSKNNLWIKLKFEKV